MVYSIWSMKCRYDPKYVSQYKSKHTKHVKLSKKVRFPLDTQKEYLNRELPLIVFGVHMNILFLIKVKIVFLIKWSCTSPPIMLITEPIIINAI